VGMWKKQMLGWNHPDPILENACILC